MNDPVPGSGRRPSRGYLQRLAVGMTVLAAALAVGPARPPAHPPACSTPQTLSAPMLLPAPDDPVYERFLSKFPAALRVGTDRRRALAREAMTAAGRHGLDPDLLVALVSVESGFNSRAVSRRGARGLGQLLFSTARAAAPDRVRRPADLYDPGRNLEVTAEVLRGLLDSTGGDVRAALRVYYAGRGAPRALRRDGARYVARVATTYAYLKTLRMQGLLTARAGSPTPRPPA